MITIKRIMKTFILIICFQVSMIGQNSNIELSPYIETSVDGIPVEAHQVLLNKMGEILTQNGIIKGVNSSIILTCNTTVSNEVITSTAPTLFVYELQATFYIGNGIDGTLYSSYPSTLKGTGTTKAKAYIDAFKAIKTNDKNLQNFLDSSKTKILNYYNTKCSTILAEVNSLESLQKYDEALYKLTSIPDASKCFAQAKQKMSSVYQKSIDNDCKLKMSNATNIWSANPNVYGANEVANILATINPNSNCFTLAKQLGVKVEKKMNDIDNREFKIRYEQEVGLEKDRIQAVKEIGKAYGNGQPQNINYNTKYWW